MVNLKKTIADLTLQLCEISSITYGEEELLQFLLAWSKKNDLYVEKLAVSDNSARFSVLIGAKQQSFYQTLLCTHIDTVPPFIAPSLENDILRGRGVCDAKGIAASMLMALLLEREQGHDDVAVLLTVGEEETSDGARSCQRTLKGRAKALVVGEPTQLKAASAQKGSMVFDIVATGREAHSSMPELGSSAVHLLTAGLAKLLAVAWPKNAEFGETFLNIGQINGGEARNMLAASARAKCIMRLSVDSATVIEKINACLGAELHCEIGSVSEPFSYVVPPGFPSFVAGFGSDAPYLKDVAEKIMLIGPGALEYAHKPNEQVHVDELVEGCLSYQKISAWVRQA